MTEPRQWNRRHVLKTAAAAGFAAALGGKATALAANPDLIKNENAKLGTRDWIAKNVRIAPETKYRSPWIEGFASRTSARHGDSLSLFVSTNPASEFTIDIYRMGYYQGTGGRHMITLGPFKGHVQPDPPIGEMRLRECAWEPCVTFTIPHDWPSGVYLGKLTAAREGFQSYVIFVVRDDRQADFLFQVSDNTWNAYNRWPSQFSLYDDGKKVWYWGPNVRTSFDRPYGKYCQILDAPLSVGSGEFLLWEFPLAFWMEQQGYDATYISNADTHADPAGLRRAKGWLSVGHDEYWSLEMFQNVKQAVADGLNVAFLSGNSICGVAPLLPSTDGRPHRIITRVGRFGSPEPAELEHGFPEEALFTQNGPNEATLMGARSTYPTTGGADWICRKPKHWLFEGTGMQEGDGIPGLVGWEWHGDPAPIPGLEVVASGTTKSPRGEGTYTATVYPGPKNNIVFNAATIWWSDGLSEPPGYVRPSV
ncbi:MAG TPA: N,N-dimethylformamidase beta subunit family domain-containing protein, partial [Isosphaeraceae bacterium]|nr:N,N-dimethylformamidase beta subunit family domain-containing protein [Isosphaeraceae bacterium]